MVPVFFGKHVIKDNNKKETIIVIDLKECFLMKGGAMYSKSENDQQSSKDLKIYDLELLVKDLKAKLKEYHGLETKLELANRNSRVLEEENVNLIMRLKSIENGKSDPKILPTNIEAMKLITDNKDLRQALENALLEVEKSKENFQSMILKFESQIRQITEERDMLFKENAHLQKELESTRRQHFELKNALEDELAISRAEIDVLVREKERLTEKNAITTSSIKFPDGSRGSNSEPCSRIDPTAVSLKELLLKEDVQELEAKLKASEERLWQKENEWLLAEAKLRSEVSALRDGNSKKINDNEIYRTLHDQISTLKQELAAFRDNQTPFCRYLEARYAHTDPELLSTEGILNRMNSSNPSVASMINEANTLPKGQLVLHNRINSLTKERDDLRENLDNLKTTLLQLQSDIEERDVRCKKLEVILATSKNPNCTNIYSRPDDPQILDCEFPRKSEHLTRSSEVSQEDEVTVLKEELKQLRSQVNDLHAIQEQKDAIHNVRLTEYQNQIAELLDENDSLCQRLNRSSCEKGLSNNDQDYLESVLAFVRDKRESIDDIMCQLEDAWAKEEEASRQIREFNKQDIAMAGYDAMKEGDIHHLQRTIVDLENQLLTEQGNHDLIDELKGELAQKNDELLFLSGKINILSEDLDDAKRNARGSSRSLEREREISKRSSRDARSVSARGRSHNARSVSARGRSHDASSVSIRRKSRSARSVSVGRGSRSNARDTRISALEQQLVETRSEIDRMYSRISRPSRRSMPVSNRATTINSQVRTPEEIILSSNRVHSPEGTSKIAILEGAHLAITIVELSNLMCKGCLITEPGSVVIKLKSIKEKYKTSVRELKTTIPFDETFQFFLAKPDQDVITLHVFYKTKRNSYVYHIGDVCFSMATLYRGVPRRRIAPVVQYPGTANACRAASIEVVLQTNDFGRMYHPSDTELAEEALRFNDLAQRFERTVPEKLHAVDVYMASTTLL
ncbi:unnamed protein product [Phytomonas sp. EM1]|nr:unnamed protein product [Phytomonas sp. EM1]|eukprot:CCW60659.1 unnamed protein product [Phytomonas sp. isolate EM1]